MNRREELDYAYHKFELQRNLTGQQPLERLQANIELLTSENQKLLNDNKNLLLAQASRLCPQRKRQEDSSEILSVPTTMNNFAELLDEIASPVR